MSPKKKQKSDWDSNTYSLIIDPTAINFLEKLDQSIGKRIFEKLQSTKVNPHHYFEHLEGRKDYKLRIGDYRAIADIDNESKQIHITIIRHRKNVYER